MSEAAPEVTTEQQEPQGGAEPKTFDADYVEKLRKENARYRTEAKANADAAKRLQEFEDRDKTEAQKLADRAEAAERRALELETRALRSEVAAEKGQPSLAQFLVGSTRDELESYADALLATLKPASSEAATDVAPSLDLGTRGAAPMALNGDPIERALRHHLGIS